MELTCARVLASGDAPLATPMLQTMLVASCVPRQEGARR
jgi:hypothetical protein